MGILATALNLLPIGQLDGGHILYSFFGRQHKLLSRVFVVALVPIGIFYSWSWLLWAVLLALFGLRHPPMFDTRSWDPARTRLGWVALVMFVLCFTLAPIRPAVDANKRRYNACNESDHRFFPVYRGRSAGAAAAPCGRVPNQGGAP